MSRGSLGVLTSTTKEAPVSTDYDGRQYVGIDLHRRRSVIVRMTPEGQQLGWSRIDNDPVALGLELAKAGPDPEVVLEATYGWYWAVDALQATGARVHLAHPLGVKGFAYRRVKNDVRDAADLCDLLRMGRLPEAYIASRGERELRELVRHRAKLVALRTGLKAQVHGVLAKQGLLPPCSDLFGVAGMETDRFRRHCNYPAYGIFFVEFLVPVVFDLARCEIANPAVRSLAIVVHLDVVEDLLPNLAQGRPGVQMDELFL